MRNNKGFTLMELMIVIAIIMILAGAIVAKIGSGTEKAMVARATAEMEEIASAARAFYVDTGYWCFWPYWGSPTDNTNDPGLISKDRVRIVIRPNGVDSWSPTDLNIVKSRWKGPYLEAKEWPLDPWGRHRYCLYYDATVKALGVICPGPDLNWASGTLFTKGVLNGDDLGLIVHRFK